MSANIAASEEINLRLVNTSYGLLNVDLQSVVSVSLPINKKNLFLELTKVFKSTIDKIGGIGTAGDLTPDYVCKQLDPEGRKVEQFDWEEDEDTTNIVLGLIKEIDGLSKPGHYFGSHPSSAGLYGFWPMPDQNKPLKTKDKIKEKLKEIGKNQSDIARELGISRQAVSQHIQKIKEIEGVDDYQKFRRSQRGNKKVEEPNRDEETY